MIYFLKIHENVEEKKKAASGERENDDIRALCMCCLSLFYFVMIGESGGSLGRWLFLLLYILQTHSIWYSSERPLKEERESRNGLSIKLCINGIFIFVCRFQAGPRVEHGQSIKDFFLFFFEIWSIIIIFLTRSDLWPFGERNKNKN